MKISYLLSRTRRFFAVAVVAFVISLAPVPAVFAESITDCSPPSPSAPGARVPTGSDAGMYHYDCDQQLWMSTHYTYNPQTDETLPLDARVYTYNSQTQQWDYEVWTYIASKGDYALRTFSVATPPSGATLIGGPLLLTPDTSIADSSQSGEVLATAHTSDGSATAVAVTNSVGSSAMSGDASVTANTTGGSATTGNANAMATLINMLQSSGNVFGSAGNAVVFNTTISGDVTGDILLDPSLIGSIQPSSTPSSGLADMNGVAHSTLDATVNNTLSVAANSGDALVAANTTAGDATSGSAKAVANVLNFLNSTIVSGRSFIGVINIDGNLNGDILLPPHFIDELLASNVPTVSIAAPMNEGMLDTSVSQSITNAVTATAESGNATVDKNTNAGNAVSGDSTTNITAFNLTGSSVVGKNALLVFVNVLGTWYGLIFNAPGATAATLGGNITTASGSPSQTVGQYDTTQVINNTIIATAQTGNATVTKNTNAGNATSGDAKVAVNILNVAQSALSLSDWFGILFINVFGSWTGSFGINTIAGSVATPVSPSAGSSNSETSSNSNSASAVFRFIPKTISSSIIPRINSAVSDDEPTDLSSGSVLASQRSSMPTSDSSKGQRQQNLYWMYATFLGVWVILIAAERVYTKMRSAH